MKHVKLLFFATLRDRAGKKSMEMELPDELTIWELKDKLSAEYPDLREVPEKCVDHHQPRICV